MRLTSVANGATQSIEFEGDHDDDDEDDDDDDGATEELGSDAHLQVFKMTKSRISFQPDPAAVLACPDLETRRDAFLAAGELCGTAVWNNIPIGVMPSLFFCRRVLHYANTSRLRVVAPRASLTKGDKCVWPTSFVKYAVDESGTTFALRRVPPLLSLIHI